MNGAQPLSPEEQKKAREIYIRAIWLPVLVFVPVATILASVAVDYLNDFGWHFKSSYLTGLLPVTAFVFGHALALKRLRQAGLSREARTIENIVKTASQFDVEARKWHYPQRKVWAAVLFGFGIGLIFLARGAQSFRLFPDLIFSSLLLLGLAFWISRLLVPILTLNEKGVSGIGSIPWTAQISWSKIVECEVTRFKNYLGDDATRTFNFKDAEGKSLLSISPAAVLGLKPEQLEDMEAEIKRRMTA